MAGEGFGLGGGNGASFGERWTDDFGNTLMTHRRNEDCAIYGCVMHARKAKSIANRDGWPVRWVNSQRKMLRMCPHGVGHPDEDSINHLIREVSRDVANAMSIHPCDGCCLGKHDPSRVGASKWRGSTVSVREQADDGHRMTQATDEKELAIAILKRWRDEKSDDLDALLANPDDEAARMAKEAAQVLSERTKDAMSGYGQRAPFGDPIAFIGVRKDRSVDMHIEPNVDPSYLTAMLAGVIREINLQVEAGLWNDPPRSL